MGMREEGGSFYLQPFYQRALPALLCWMVSITCSKLTALKGYGRWVIFSI